MPKIAFIGAGSRVFAIKLVRDILSFDSLADSHIALMDIDESRLEDTEEAASKLIESGDVDASLTATTDREAVLEDADYVLNMINVGGTEPFINEIRIPEAYGVKQAIGDTLGPGGIFRALRTIPTMLDIAEDIERLCPDALLLNYTNPMAIVCWAVREATDVDVIGLCHSVQHTAHKIARYTDTPEDELTYWVAGINHMAWFLEASHEGESLYPALYEAMEDPEMYEQDTVRFELLRHFGAFVTESSHHNSEYFPYFRTEQETIDQLKGTGSAGRMPTATYLEGWQEKTQSHVEEPFDENDLEIRRSEEYASRIMDSLETGTERRFNVNLSNEDGAISNLPANACVEVPTFVDDAGVHPCTVGDLPPQLAALNRTNINVQELAVKAALEKDRSAVHHAVKLDPLSGAACTLDELHAMTEELLEANAEYLPDWN